jgi:sugar-specific transcriptional regulator TrmB
MLNELLSKLGFSEKEIQVYLTILENGKILPAAISKITNIKRPTVYVIGNELVKKGVVTQDLEEAGGYFVALPPEHLNTIAEREEKKVIEKKKIIKDAIEELADIPKSKSYSVPKMRFINEYNMKDFFYRQSPIWDQSMISSGNPTWWGFQDHTFVEHKEYLDWIDWYWKQAPKEIDLKLISNDSEIEEKMKLRNYSKRHIKFWKKDFEFTATHQVLGDYVLFFMTNQRPHYLVEIHDAVYAENMRQVYKNLWEII